MPTKPSNKKKQPAPSKPAAPVKATPAAPARPTASATYDMASLAASLGPPDEAFAARAFAGASEAALLERGIRTDSQNIVDDIPRFVGSALEIQKGLSNEQAQSVKLPAAMFPLVLHEASVLQAMKAEHEAAVADTAGDKADREQSARRLSRKAILERDVTYDALRNALGDERMAKVDAVVGTADSSDNLARGLDGLAKFIEETAKGSPADAEALDDYDVGVAQADKLRATAEQVRRLGAVTAVPGRKVSQRALDIQDGRVLLLVERVIRAFRAAHRADASILVPALNKIAWMFESRSSSKPKPPAPAKAGAAKADGATDKEPGGGTDEKAPTARAGGKPEVQPKAEAPKGEVEKAPETVPADA